MTKQQKDKILELYKNSKSYKFISIETGLPASTIASFLRREHNELLRCSRDKIENKRMSLAKKFSLSSGLHLDVSLGIICEAYQKYLTKQAHAKKRNMEFSIDFFNLDFPVNCPLLGIKLDYFAKGPVKNNISFDRVDNSKGYIEGNVIIMSLRANKLKNDSNSAELALLSRNLAKIEKHPD